jgi:tRNA-2-methylthio-N6-dimethylallyladenosine synthase
VDDVAHEAKSRRLAEIVALQNRLSLESNKVDLGQIVTVLIEGDSKRSEQDWRGRNSQNKVVVFPKTDVPGLQKGDYVEVLVKDCSQATLIGNATKQKYHP